MYVDIEIQVISTDLHGLFANMTQKSTKFLENHIALYTLCIALFKISINTLFLS